MWSPNSLKVCLSRSLLHFEWLLSEGPNLKVTARDSQTKPVHSSVIAKNTQYKTKLSRYTNRH